jgi:stringent starvation protein A
LAYRSAITLYCEPRCVMGHGVRLVVAEKDISINLVFVSPGQRIEDVLQLNPYGDILTLVDRDIALFEPQVMLEYLDERFPHPPLMPVDPRGRADNRQLRARIHRELHPLIRRIEQDERATEARRILREYLTAMQAPLAGRKEPHLLGEDYSLADCVMSPILWRLEELGVSLPASASALTGYAKRVHARRGFQLSLQHTSGRTLSGE